MSIGSLQNLIDLIAKLPGLGPRSARRAALHLIQDQNHLMLSLATALRDVAQEMKVCENCGNIDITALCNICTDAKRDESVVCVVESIADLWAMERINAFKGTYHVLGGTLSALDGRTPQTLNIESLKKRVAGSNVKEVIIAMNATLEGQTTGHYLVDFLMPYDLKITRLACGIPVGAELDYMDEGTLALALKLRHDF